MLPKENRLNQDTEIKQVAKNGQSFFLPEFTIKYQKNKESTSKFGFVVSTKVDKRAVVRHKLTRQLRETIRKELNQLKPGYSVLIIAKKRALELDFQKIGQQLNFAFSKIKLYNKS